MGGRRFQHRLPPHTTLVRWQRERPWLVVGIEQHEECFVQEWLPLRVFFLNGMAVQPYAKAADIPFGPIAAFGSGVGGPYGLFVPGRLAVLKGCGPG